MAQNETKRSQMFDALKKQNTSKRRQLVNRSVQAATDYGTLLQKNDSPQLSSLVERA